MKLHAEEKAYLGHLLPEVCNIQQGAGKPHADQWLPHICYTKLKACGGQC